MLRILKWAGIGLATIVLAGAVYLGVRIAEWRAKAPEAVATIIASMDPAIDRIPETRIDMLLAVEDPTFWTNRGIDLQTPGAGLTTLAQGLGKHIFYDGFSPGLQKIELMALTRFALSPTVDRRDILRAALASAYLGNDDAGAVIGFAEGARRYFGKPLDELTDREWLSLVALLPAPNALTPTRHPEANAERVARMERLIAGDCRPDGLNDVMLEACAQ
jgi:membrane peptidoglycan carboxypeptidase